MKSTPDTFPLISVILPIYNVEDFLPQCLDSVINQTYKNLEIILVNDGSTDSCPQICEKYALKDSRIKVIHKKNTGSADSRNVGFTYATGDFISFVDSDDILNEQYCEKLLNTLLENNADIVECDFLKFEHNTEIDFTIKPNNDIAEIYDTHSAMKLLFDEMLSVVVWNKIYRKEILKGIEFPVGKYIDDIYWTYKVFGNAKKIVKVSDVLYYYRKHPNSIMQQKFSIRRLDAIPALEERIYYMREHFPDLENISIRHYCFGVFAHYHLVYRNRQIDLEGIHRNNLKNNIRNYHKWSILKQWTWKDVVWFYIFWFSPKIYMTVRDYYERKNSRINMKSNL